ncbi:hypothetical protein MA16_Dca023318 [Dendrobium catenatum]|uniref:Uncharacterized protein n=1 Tax=Dendrobium catenatum TaxID=906689 RepID=A0A2I0VHB3_9ASPA|nr:hypothetical protein MA16_Dca023318 [Dendrobium catenatum]
MKKYEAKIQKLDAPPSSRQKKFKASSSGDEFFLSGGEFDVGKGGSKHLDCKIGELLVLYLNLAH